MELLGNVSKHYGELIIRDLKELGIIAYLSQDPNDRYMDQIILVSDDHFDHANISFLGQVTMRDDFDALYKLFISDAKTFQFGERPGVHDLEGKCVICARGLKIGGIWQPMKFVSGPHKGKFACGIDCQDSYFAAQLPEPGKCWCGAYGEVGKIHYARPTPDQAVEDCGTFQ